MWPGCARVCVCGWMIWSEQFRSTGNGVTNNSGIESKWRIMTSMRDELFLLFGRGSLARFGEDFSKWNLEGFEVIIICERYLLE